MKVDYYCGGYVEEFAVENLEKSSKKSTSIISYFSLYELNLRLLIEGVRD